MQYLLRMDQPIPSCAIWSMDWANGSWVYEYMADIPFIIPDEMGSVELMVYGHIADLRVRVSAGQHPESVFIPFTSMSEWMQLLSMQREADLHFRREWIATHPDRAIPAMHATYLERRRWSHAELEAAGVHAIAGVITPEEMAHGPANGMYQYMTGEQVELDQQAGGDFFAFA